MTKVPQLPYDKVIKTLRRAGWVVVGKRAVIFACKNTHLLKP